MITLLTAIALGIVVALFVLLRALPAKVQYIETITVQAPVANVYDAIRFQEQLMAWSAWPAETNSQCTIRNTDGEVGAQTVYISRGKPFGFQEVIHLTQNEKVSFSLKSKAPFEQKTTLHFILKEVADNGTEVNLWFDNTLKKPSLLFPYLFGIVNWTHQMHLKDLAGLKKFVEVK